MLPPDKPWRVKGDYNVNSGNKVTFRYNQLDSSTDVNQSGSSSLGTSRQTGTTQFLTFDNPNYQILENLKSGVGEWNSVFGTMTNNLLVGYTHQDESRGDKGPLPLCPVVATVVRCRLFHSSGSATVPAAPTPRLATSRSRHLICSATTRSRRRTAS